MDAKKFFPVIIFALIILAACHQFIYQPVQRKILNMELEARRLREVERELSELKARHGNLSAFVEAKESDAARKSSRIHGCDRGGHFDGRKKIFPRDNFRADNFGNLSPIYLSAGATKDFEHGA